MEPVYTEFKKGILAGIRKGWGGFVWMLKILVPISFLTSLLVYSGWINRLDFMLEPAMGLLNLPSIAALPLIVGMLTGIYGGIAAMIALPLSSNQMTLMAVFLLISHNLIQEGIVQSKSGLPIFRATLFRLTASVVTVIIAGQFLHSETVPLVVPSPTGGPQPFMAMLSTWGRETLRLGSKIFVIIMALMIALELMKTFKLIEPVGKFLTPLLKTLGLERKMGMLWLTAAVFGLAYGAAVIVEETGKGDFSSQELQQLHLSIGINHAMVEDPALFLPLGLNPFWLWVPRIITAALMVQFLNLMRKCHIFHKCRKQVFKT